MELQTKGEKIYRNPLPGTVIL